jgi:hypothetical protein
MKKKIILLNLSFVVLLFSMCGNDQSSVLLTTPNNPSTQQDSSKTVNFNLSDAVVNTDAEATILFNNTINGWDINRASISGNALKITLPPEAGSDNGMECRIDVTDNAKYELSFDIKFQLGFDFSKGGKLGFGFAIGDGVSGGRNTEATIDNLGGSFRVMWRTDKGVPYLHPYVYYKDMLVQFGTDFESSRYNNIVADQYYRIRLTINVNTSPTLPNGYGKMEVSANGGATYATVWEKKDIRWSGGGVADLKVKTLYFSTFRGGKDSSWDGSSAQSIYFDNLNWKILP